MPIASMSSTDTDQTFPRLETERLLLREIVDDDVPALLRIHGDREHMRWFGSEVPGDLEQARKLVALFSGWRRLPNPGTRWGMELKRSPGLIGSCGLFAWNRGWRKCATGYEIAPELQGQGLMQEALAAIYDWGFAQMALNRIEAQVHEHNAASVNLLERMGFVFEGRLREVAFWDGRHHDLLQYSLLASDWSRRV
jgi:ribosomal-protein-alanine N-acetyltransferase